MWNERVLSFLGQTLECWTFKPMPWFKMLFWMLWAAVVWPIVQLALTLVLGALWSGFRLGWWAAAIWLLPNFTSAIFYHRGLFPNLRASLRLSLAFCLAVPVYLLTCAIVQSLFARVEQGNAQWLAITYFASLVLVLIGAYCLQPARMDLK
jgi:hypothetical protein